jgi:hypothetical protein
MAQRDEPSFIVHVTENVIVTEFLSGKGARELFEETHLCPKCYSIPCILFCDALDNGDITRAFQVEDIPEDRLVIFP